MNSRLLLLAFAFACATLVNAQTATRAKRPVEPQLEWATSYEFTTVGGAFEYPRGTMLINDVSTKALFMIAARGTRVTAVGRVGSGPSEYRQPRSLMHSGSGLARLVDPSLRRLSDIDDAGTFVAQRGFPLGANGLSGRVSSDEQGALYFLSMPLNPQESRTVQLLRVANGSEKMDTLMSMRGTALADLPDSPARGTSGSVARRSLSVIPYSPKDGFAVLRSGEIVLLRGETGIVEWHSADGKLLEKRVLPTPRTIEISSSERSKIRPIALRELVPKRRSAFDEDFMIAGAGGDVWVPRVTTGDKKRTEWVIVNRKRTQARSFVLTTSTRLLHVSDSSVTVAESDADDIERVARYRIELLGQRSHRSHILGLKRLEQFTLKVVRDCAAPCYRAKDGHMTQVQPDLAYPA